MGKLLLVLGACAAAAGCGTYSLVRPADTLPQGKVELSAGLAASALGEVNTIVHAAYGVTDDIEVIAQNEIWNTFVEGRYGFLHERDDCWSLAVGLGGGQAVTLVSAIGDELDEDTADTGGAGLVSVSVGKRLGPVDLTFGNRTFVQFDGGFLMSSTRLAARLPIGRHFGLMLEAGGTAHAPVESLDLALFLAEASTGFWVGF
jgi:hypothetical protein